MFLVDVRDYSKLLISSANDVDDEPSRYAELVSTYIESPKLASDAVEPANSPGSIS
jgi:hypothetical protein